MGSSPHLCFFPLQNSDFRTRLTSLYGSQNSSVVLSTHNSVLSTRIKRLCWFQPSRVVLCMQITDFSTWITSLYWSQPSSVVFACKTASFGPAYKSLWAPDLTCRFVHTNSVISTRNTTFSGFQPSSVVLCIPNSALMTKIGSLYESQPSCVVFGCKRATFGLELQGSFVQKPHLLFFHAKLRLLDQNNNSLWVPDMTCHCVHVQQRA